MKDLVFIIVIISFWFILASGLSYMANDPALSELSALDGNNTYTLISTQESAINISSVSGEGTNPESFVSMLIRMFTFRIPKAIAPAGINLFINFLNYFLLVILGLLIYRLVRSGAG